ncbi:zinc finger protein 407 [Arapaima gigas]
MDDSKNKRKLRSSREVVGEEGAREDDGAGAKEQVAGSETCRQVKKPKVDDNIEAQNREGTCFLGSEAVAVKDSGNEHRNVGVGDSTSDSSCICSLCDFVAKTPTALKVHTTRKHSRKGPSLRDESTAGKRGKKEDLTQLEWSSQRSGLLEAGNHGRCHHCSFRASSSDHLATHMREKHHEKLTSEQAVLTSTAAVLDDQSETVLQQNQHGDDSSLTVISSKDDETGEAETLTVTNTDEIQREMSPTRILLEMIDAAADKSEITNKSIEESNQSSQKSKQQPITTHTVANVTSGADVEAPEKSSSLSHPVESVARADSSNTEGKHKPLITVGEQGLPVHTKVKRSPKSKAQQSCSYCGHVFQDKPSLLAHTKQRHTKEMKFSCKVCSYACVTKSDYEKHCLSNRHKKRILDTAKVQGSLPPEGSDSGDQRVYEIEVQIHSEGTKSSATRLAAAQLLKRSASARPQLQCKACGYKTSSSTLLLRHERLKHPNEIRYHCKPCCYYTTTTEGMAKHLARKKHQQSARKENIGSSFEECVEKVCMKSSVDHASPSKVLLPSDESLKKNQDEHRVQPSHEGDKATESVGTRNGEKTEDASPPKKKRGRPKSSMITTCDYCGLVASSATNLNVHIRRRHSRQYSFACKLCNYYCVTKGDMDRHCATKKHMKRIQAASRDNSEDSQVIPGSVVEVLDNAQASSVEAVEDSTSEGVAVQETQGSRLSKPEETLDEDAFASGQLSHHKDRLETEDSITVHLEDADQEVDGPASKKSKYDSVNSCVHCDFVAHSLPSLELHIKRKHTKDFEFVCKACNYYAVTRREMSRHATTEKHKQKSQSYLESLRKNEIDLSCVDKETVSEGEAVPEGDGKPSAKNPEAQDAAAAQNTSAGEDNNTEMSGNVTLNTDLSDVLEVEKSDADRVDKVSSQGSPEGSAPLAIGSRNVEVKIDGGIGENQVLLGDNSVVTAGGAGFVKSVAKSEAVTEEDIQMGEAEAEEYESSSDSDPDLGDGREYGSSSVKQLVRAVPFDASIVPAKTLQKRAPSGQDGTLTANRGTTVSQSVDTSSPQRGRKPGGVKARGGVNSRIRCEDCGFLADGLSGLNVHIAMKHPSKEKHFHCMLCGKSFYTESNLHQHLSSAAHLRNEQDSIEELPEGGASFKCVKCTEPFETEQELFVHIKEKHEELLREVNKYILEDTEQINKEREENQGSVCKYCGKVCKSSNSMAFLAHVRTHTGSKPFKCTICNFATAQLGDARNHVKRHLGMREYKCHVCGWAFVMKKHLSTHLLGKHGMGRPKERKFECELCDRTFSERWALNNHTKLHTGEKPYKCVWPSCHYSFVTLSAMKDHYRTHTGEKSFLCDLCGFAGGTRHALTKHRRQHTGEKPFRCTLCSFASTTQSHLTRHKRVHTGEKPYRCPWCEYRSNCAENIRKHILHTGKHEGVKMYNCPKCDYGSNAPMEFRNHLKERHPDIENPDLAYLHAGIVSKSFECRLKGQGASFVETEAAYAVDEATQSTRHSSSGGEEAGAEAVQQVIIIQDYGGGLAVDSTLEESAAAALQTLAEVLHITEDGQVITAGPTQDPSSAVAAHHAGTTQFVLVESGEPGLLTRPEEGVAASASPSALDALLCAVTELGTAQEEGVASQEVSSGVEPYESQEVGGEQFAAAVHKEQEGEVEVYGEVVEEGGEPMEVVTQVVHSSGAPEAPEDMVHEVLQFAASQLMMKEGLTQVIVNDEGTHFIVTELDESALQVGDAVYAPGEGAQEQAAVSGEVAEAEAAAAVVVYSNASTPDAVMEE